MYLFCFLNDNIKIFEDLLKHDATSVKFIFFKISNSFYNLVSSINKPEKREILLEFYYKKLESRLKIIIQVNF